MRTQGYIYIRGEYRYLIEIVDRAIDEAYARGFWARTFRARGFDFDLYTHSGAGAYECGEESALLESLEGKRGIRASAAVSGGGGRVPVPHRAEQRGDVCAVPAIIRDGGAAFAALGTPKNGGTR
jgi:NADH-quinone oxidoreductase subunit F